MELAEKHDFPQVEGLLQRLASELIQKNLPSYFAKQSEQADFKYTKHNLEIYGVCKDCSKSLVIGGKIDH